ncbi:MAG: hypothetical protein KF849_18995 [Rhizobiaceae bacterium]|nr:hypothetical protein [Rhizobiaceae bacterium]
MMSLASRIGIFLPDEIEAMRLEFDAGNVQNETAAQREDRAAAIIARFQARKTEVKPPQL